MQNLDVRGRSGSCSKDGNASFNNAAPPNVGSALHEMTERRPPLHPILERLVDLRQDGQGLVLDPNGICNPLHLSTSNQLPDPARKEALKSGGNPWQNFVYLELHSRSSSLPSTNPPFRRLAIVTISKLRQYHVGFNLHTTHHTQHHHHHHNGSL